ncbi:hypothetical protein [Streptomyces alboviridis]|uniref:hypothetical protein n=1 Tax=Streptomyces alboviridis TaxID=67269 RepID=UPI0005172135|nr:hypothetical protein [Streptomyces alboviridis]
MTATDDPQGTHFWFMAIQTPNSAGYNVGSYQGAVTPPPGFTRLAFFNEMRAEIDRRHPEAKGGVVIAFDVQPNQL